MQEVLHVRYKTASIFYPKPADEEFPAGHARLGGRSPWEVYTETHKTEMIEGRPLAGAWLLWVSETDGQQYVRRWGDNPYRDTPESDEPA